MGETTLKFKVGQTVELVDNNDMNAKVGSIAIIKRIDKEFLYVMWTTLQTQSDGAYYPYHFKSMLKKGEQLLFAFMKD